MFVYQDNLPALTIETTNHGSEGKKQNATADAISKWRWVRVQS
jgi:hypothetical protein